MAKKAAKPVVKAPTIPPKKVVAPKRAVVKESVRAKQVNIEILIHMVDRAQELADELRNALGKGNLTEAIVVADIIDTYARALSAAAVAAK